MHCLVLQIPIDGTHGFVDLLQLYDLNCEITVSSLGGLLLGVHAALLDFIDASLDVLYEGRAPFQCGLCDCQVTSVEDGGLRCGGAAVIDTLSTSEVVPAPFLGERRRSFSAPGSFSAVVLFLCEIGLSGSKEFGVFGLV